MRRKYIMIFLMGLLCLVCSAELHAQYCVLLKYDDNGNRTNLSVRECFVESRNVGQQEIIGEEISEGNNDGLIVYPNPNKGIFNIELCDEVDEKYEAVLQIYDNRGVMLSECEFIRSVSVDIGNNPAGLYLLRIIRGEEMYNRIVVKL